MITEITYLFKKKCQRCHKMYATDFKGSKYCYFCSQRPKSEWSRK